MSGSEKGRMNAFSAHQIPSREIITIVVGKGPDPAAPFQAIPRSLSNPFILFQSTNFHNSGWEGGLTPLLPSKPFHDLFPIPSSDFTATNCHNSGWEGGLTPLLPSKLIPGSHPPPSDSTIPNCY